MLPIADSKDRCATNQAPGNSCAGAPSPASQIGDVAGDAAGVNDDERDDDEEVSNYTEKNTMLLYTPADLLHAVWKPSDSISRNLRLVLSALSRFICVYRSAETVGPCRLPDAIFLRLLFKDIYKGWISSSAYKNWIEGSSIDAHCAASEISYYLMPYVPPPFRQRFSHDGMFTENGFDAWVKYCKKYCGEMIALRSTQLRDKDEEPIETGVAMSDTEEEERIRTAAMKKSVQRENDEVSPVIGKSTLAEASSQRLKRGLDALFSDEGSFVASSTTRISQHVTKLQDGRFLSLKSPGEMDDQLIRIQIYDTKDVLRREQRYWWKWAKYRVQYLSSSTTDDRKRRLLFELMDTAVDDIKKINGVLRETKRFSPED